jgi:flagellar motor switch protein FliN
MPQETLKQLIPAVTQRLAQSLEAMTGANYGCEAADLPPGHRPSTDALVWAAGFNQGQSSTLRIAAELETWKAIGRAVLEAAGVDSVDDATVQSTYIETLAQVGSAVTQDLTSISGAKWEVTHSGAEGAWVPGDDSWVCHIQLPLEKVSVSIQASPSLMAALASAATPTAAAPTASGSREETGPPSQFDLLLDVELPVSISFGRALVQLKDILKLNSGSIVELNRAVTEPVEVIVNNCVIAKGEVVVVEGNYGVRIQQIISRQDRLRTMH